MNMYAKFQLHPPYGFWGEDFWIIFRKLPFILPWQPIKFSDLDKIHMNRRGLLKKHFCRKKNLSICSETAINANFNFFHYKSMKTISCHSNQSSYPIGTKNTIIRSPTYRCYMWNMGEKTASEEKSFENVDGRRTDRRRMPAYTISSTMSLRLRWAKKDFIFVRWYTIL